MYSWIYTASMSLTHNGSTALQHFKRSNAIKIRNGIMFDFYLGLPHVHVGDQTLLEWIPTHVLQSLATRLVEFEKHYPGIYRRSTTRYATTSKDKTQFCILCMLRIAVHSAECELHVYEPKLHESGAGWDRSRCTFSMVETSRGFLLRMSLGSAVSTSSCGI